MLVLLRTVGVGIKPERIDYAHGFRLPVLYLAAASRAELMGVQSHHPNLLAS
jgi:hypothetical protein